MSKAIRVVVVFVSLAVLVAIGQNGNAWADKLGSGVQSPDLSLPGQAVQPATRPQGTVITTPVCVTATAPGTFTVGSAVKWTVGNVAGGRSFQSCVAKQSDLPAGPAVVLLSAPIKLVGPAAGTPLGTAQRFCLPVPPGKNGSAYFWNGTVWIKTEKAQGGIACVNVPADALAPVFVALLQEP